MIGKSPTVEYFGYRLRKPCDLVISAPSLRLSSTKRLGDRFLPCLHLLLDREPKDHVKHGL